MAAVWVVMACAAANRVGRNGPYAEWAPTPRPFLFAEWNRSRRESQREPLRPKPHSRV